MTNYMYHQRKEFHDSLETTLDSPTWMSTYARANNGNQRGELFYYDEDVVYNYDIDEKMIHNVCRKYSMFGDYLNNTQKKLNEMGIYAGEIEDREVEEVEFIQDAILGEILWQTLKKK